jgi:hypothetical protein
MSSFGPKSIRYSSLLPSLLLGITLQFPPYLFGEELTASQVPQTDTQEPQAVPETPEPAPLVPQPGPQPVLPTPYTGPRTPTSDSFSSWEASRDYLSGKITGFASYLDRFFGGDRHYQESNGTVVQLDLTKLNGYGGDQKLDLAVRANLRLPVTEGRLHLLVETAPEKNIITGPTPVTQPVAVPGQTPVPNNLALALRYAKAKEDVWHFNFDWGIRFPIPPKPFVRTRVSYSVPIGEWRLKAAESVYWFNTLGAGETTQLDLERIISPPLLFRSSSIVTWLNDNQNLDMRQDLSIYHTVTDRSALLYQASAIGINNPQYQMTDFVMLVLYRYRMHKEWLFFELSPQLHFPRDRQYHFSPALSMRLEALFDDSR